MEAKGKEVRLLVTGASGLLGTRLCQLAIRQKHEVFSAYSEHKPMYGIPVHLNVTDNQVLKETFRTAKPEAVLHAAALSDVDRCERERELAWKTNAEATANIAILCNDYGAFLFYVSTDYVFNGKRGQYEESDTTDPINTYGLSKLRGEEVVEESRAESCIGRTSVIYGAIPASGKTNFALWLIEKLRKDELVSVVTDQWNSPTLNTNLAQMILEILDRRMTGIYNLAGATRTSRFEFAILIAETFDLDLDLIRPVSSDVMSWAARRPKDSSLNVDKATHALRNKPLELRAAVLEMKKEMQWESR